MCVMSNRPIQLVGLLALVMLTGCYSYNPYGYGGYPEVLSTVPAPSIAPAGAPIPGQPIAPGAAPIGPQAATPAGIVQPLQVPSTLGTPPAATTPGATAPQPVPRYVDPTDPAAGATGGESTQAGDAATESSSFRAPTGGTLTGATGGNPAEETAGAVIQAKGETATTTAGTIPAPVTAGLTEPAADPVSLPEIKESNYGYDTTGYTWFKGKIEYDKADKAWHLMYAPTPNQNDPYGGDISLADDPRLEALQDNDVVYVTGTLRSGLSDRTGKPRFRIDQLSNITVGP
tara:strand:- start:686 stop:1549 length:864 start_codon:yes stop_codon:yes gene_type:complete